MRELAWLICNFYLMLFSSFSTADFKRTEFGHYTRFFSPFFFLLYVTFCLDHKSLVPLGNKVVNFWEKKISIPTPSPPPPIHTHTPWSAEMSFCSPVFNVFS